MFVFGLLCLVIGGPLAWLGWRRLQLWNRIDGTVIGVHEGVQQGEDGSRKVFHAVIRYVDAAGVTKKMLSDAGENSLDKIKIGATVLLAINPKDDSMTATVAVLNTLAIIGSVALAVGAALISYGIYDWSLGSVIPLLVGIVFVAAIGWSSLAPLISLGKDPALLAAAKAEKQKRLAAAIAESDDLTESEMSKLVANEAHGLADMKAKAGFIVYPLRIVFGIALLVVAGPWSVDRLLELYGAEQTVGTAVGYGTTVGLFQDGRFRMPGLHVVVEFQSASDGKRTVVDWLGTKSPTFSQGENVPVRYVAGKPSRATIDRGAWNWAPAVVVLVFGIFLIAHSLWQLLAARKR
jgi:hypothetical protein